MTKLKELNIQNFKEIIRIIHNICDNIQRFKYIKKTNNSNPRDVEFNYRDNIALILNCIHSPFEGLVNVEAQNNHGKADIIINFLNNKKYVVECFVLNDSHNISTRIEKKFDQLIYNIINTDDKISLILFVLKKTFEPIKIFEEIKTVIEKQSMDEKLIGLQKENKNTQIFTTKINKFPELKLYIHVGIYHFFYDFNYSKVQQKTKKQ